MHFIRFQLRVTKWKLKSSLKRRRYGISPETKTASERQYIVAGGEVQVLEVVFTCVGQQNKEIDTRSGKANAVLRELHRSVATKWELSNTAKLSVY